MVNYIIDMEKISITFLMDAMTKYTCRCTYTVTVCIHAYILFIDYNKYRGILHVLLHVNVVFLSLCRLAYRTPTCSCTQFHLHVHIHVHIYVQLVI